MTGEPTETSRRTHQANTPQAKPSVADAGRAFGVVLTLVGLVPTVALLRNLQTEQNRRVR